MQYSGRLLLHVCICCVLDLFVQRYKSTANLDFVIPHNVQQHLVCTVV